MNSSPAAAATSGGDAASLNRDCFCISLDSDALKRALQADPETADLFQLIRDRCPHLFSNLPVFVSSQHLDQMAAVIRAVETVVALPAYREAVLAWAPTIARFEPAGARGVFLSYDFHLGASGPQLIEINTNAGGALLNAALARAQRACCAAMEGMTAGTIPLDSIDGSFLEMFKTEWRLSRGARALRSIAIVDDQPEQQYLYPEFLLFRRLFSHHGFHAIIADASEFRLRDGVLWHGNEKIDLVYNRLTDFTLEQPAHAALREAYLSNAAVLTPHPRAHALYADKRNLAVLSDSNALRRLGVVPKISRTLLDGIPRTQTVDPALADRLWSERRGLFFKPAAGYGSKAAYRGDKITHRVWNEILKGDYVAQAFVSPGERMIGDVPDHEAPLALKFDLRNYVYDGQVQFVAARMYHGQTTNFRTPGGGFAPVFTLRESAKDPNPRTEPHRCPDKR
jgi:hypothetical protein